MLSSSQTAHALSLNSNQIWRGWVCYGGGPMFKGLAQYRQLEIRLWWTRWRYEGQESAEEDALLDEMDHIWLNLTDHERSLLRVGSPRCWPDDPTSLPPQFARTLDSSASTPWAYEGCHSSREAILSADAA